MVIKVAVSVTMSRLTDIPIRSRGPLESYTPLHHVSRGLVSLSFDGRCYKLRTVPHVVDGLWIVDPAHDITGVSVNDGQWTEFERRGEFVLVPCYCTDPQVTLTLVRTSGEHGALQVFARGIILPNRGEIVLFENRQRHPFFTCQRSKNRIDQATQVLQEKVVVPEIVNMIKPYVYIGDMEPQELELKQNSCCQVYSGRNHYASLFIQSSCQLSDLQSVDISFDSSNYFGMVHIVTIPGAWLAAHYSARVNGYLLPIPMSPSSWNHQCRIEFIGYVGNEPPKLRLFADPSSMWPPVNTETLGYFIGRHSLQCLPIVTFGYNIAQVRAREPTIIRLYGHNYPCAKIYVIPRKNRSWMSPSESSALRYMRMSHDGGGPWFLEGDGKFYQSILPRAFGEDESGILCYQIVFQNSSTPYPLSKELDITNSSSVLSTINLSRLPAPVLEVEFNVNVEVHVVSEVFNLMHYGGLVFSP